MQRLDNEFWSTSPTAITMSMTNKHFNKRRVEYESQLNEVFLFLCINRGNWSVCMECTKGENLLVSYADRYLVFFSNLSSNGGNLFLVWFHKIVYFLHEMFKKKISKEGNVYTFLYLLAKKCRKMNLRGRKQNKFSKHFCETFKLICVCFSQLSIINSLHVIPSVSFYSSQFNITH